MIVFPIIEVYALFISLMYCRLRYEYRCTCVCVNCSIIWLLEEKKEYVLTLTLQGYCCNFSVCCRVDGNRIVLVGTSTKLFIILYITRVIKVSRLLSKVGHPSKQIISDTLAYLSNLLNTYRAACLWTISIACILHWWYGDLTHIVINFTTYPGIYRRHKSKQGESFRICDYCMQQEHFPGVQETPTEIVSIMQSSRLTHADLLVNTKSVQKTSNYITCNK